MLESRLKEILKFIEKGLKIYSKPFNWVLQQASGGQVRSKSAKKEVCVFSLFNSSDDAICAMQDAILAPTRNNHKVGKGDDQGRLQEMHGILGNAKKRCSEK